MIGAPKRPSASEILESTETWSARATLLILFGIVLEIGILFIFAHAISSWEKAGLVLADVLIAIGLGIEYVCIKKSGRAAAQLKTESDQFVADAKQKASEAEECASIADQKAQEAILELAKFRAPRLLTGQQVRQIAEKLKQFSGTEYDVALQSNDPECRGLLWFMEIIFLRAGWKALSWPAPAAIITSRGLQVAVGISATNIIVGIDLQRTSALRSAVQCLVDELMAIGIDATAASMPAPGISPNTTAVHILIGRKS